MQKEYTLRIKEMYIDYCGQVYAVQRKYWIFWITVDYFETPEKALAFDYCKHLRKIALMKEVRRRLKKPYKITCECPPKVDYNA